MDLDLKSKTFLVTGGSSGIGLATVEILAEEGANVIIQYNSGESRAISAQKMALKYGVQAEIIQCDLRQEVQIEAMFRLIEQIFGRIDGIINNAGIWPEEDIPIHKMDTSHWENTINVNLRSVFLCNKYFLNMLDKFPGEHAAIVLVGSTAGVFGEAGHNDYSITKSAMHGLMLSTKNEIVKLARYARINIVSPGWTLTPMAEEGLKQEAAVIRVLQTTALRKIATARDIANTIVFLLSDRVSSHTTGQQLVLAGGMEGRLLWQPNEVDPNLFLGSIQ
ncbi:MAG: SDR family oxidoreductase [Candidatus Heimdallarchaeota archaeon]|nr:SDR family oxidoreductase [Candidatus Heimdallarchaeota archaeon]